MADDPKQPIYDTTEEFIEIPTPDFSETYRNVKHLIYDGFIPVKFKLGDVNLTLKAVYPREFSYIELLTSKDHEKVPYYFLYSIVLIDGAEILPHRKELHECVVDVFSKMDAKVVDQIFKVITSVQKYYYWSYENLEGYLYENESRYLWSIYQNSILNNALVGGAGSYNTAQESWVIFNQREDIREQMVRDFNNSKFIVSALVGSKEVKKLDNLEAMRDMEEQKRRQEVRLKNKTEKLRLSAPTNTAAELIQELHRQMRGEKDLHDRIIERHEQRMFERERELRVKQEEARKIAALKKPRFEEGSKPVTAQEMKERLQAAADVKYTRHGNPLSNKYLEKLGQYRGKDPEPEPVAPVLAPLPPAKKGILDPEVQKMLKEQTKKPVKPEPTESVKPAGARVLDIGVKKS